MSDYTSYEDQKKIDNYELMESTVEAQKQYITLLEQEVKELREHRDRLLQRNNITLQEKRDAEAKLAEAQAAIDYEGAKAIAKQAQGVIDERDKRIAELEHELQAAKNAEEYLRSAYRAMADEEMCQRKRVAEVERIATGAKEFSAICDKRITELEAALADMTRHRDALQKSLWESDRQLAEVLHG